VTARPITALHRSTAMRSRIRMRDGRLASIPDSGILPHRMADRSRWLIATLVLLCLFASAPDMAGEFRLSHQGIVKIGQEYGEFARQRIMSWQALIRTGSDLSDLQKLQRVNHFFNALEFVNDVDHWGKKDYWATPLETLISDGGDCEDFSIAKYFTLLEMGIPADRMRLTYVKALKLNQAHMVLTYFPAPDADPLVLDNLYQEIRPATQRDDLLPVYSFNGEGLWLAKKQFKDSRPVGRADRLAPWRELIARISDEMGPLPARDYAIDSGNSYAAPGSVGPINQ
jgi:predicted transglutaminase-like cysteine proteinase